MHPRAVGQCGGEQRMLAINALVGRGRNLPRQSPQRCIVERRRVVPLGPFTRVEPQFARTVNVQIGDVVASQIRGERYEESVEIDPMRRVHLAAPTLVKSRSRATKIRTAAPCRVVIVGGISALPAA